MSARPLLARVVEFFTLKDALRAAEGVPERTRSALAERLALGRQRADCADILWTNGHTAEGLSLALAALDATVEGASGEGAEGEAAGEPRDAWERLREALLSHMDRIELDDLRDVLRRAEGPLPKTDRDVSPAHAELFAELVRARTRIDRVLAPRALTKRAIGFSRALRVGAAILVLVGVALALALALRRPSAMFASASAFFEQSPRFAPEMAIDGSATTSWLLPDGATGWLEVSLSPPRHVDRVRLLNTTNPPWSDRATRDYRLELYAHGALARTLDGSFEWTDAPSFVDRDVGLDDIDRVRFVVRSFHRVGAGLAELQID